MIMIYRIIFLNAIDHNINAYVKEKIYPKTHKYIYINDTQRE